MKSQLYLCKTAEANWAWQFQAGKLTALQAVHPEVHQLGDVIVGKVVRVLPKAQAAYVDFGSEALGYWQATPREKLQALDEGTYKHFQIIRSATANKATKLSSTIQLASRFFVYQPQHQQLRVARTVEQRQSENLKSFYERLMAEHDLVAGIIRSQADTADEAILRQDFQLIADYAFALKKEYIHKAGTVVLKQATFFQRQCLTDYATNIDEIIVEQGEVLASLRQFCQQYAPDILGKLCEKSVSQFVFEPNSAIQELLQIQVDLPSGGNLLIEKTHAAWVIDVNTAAHVSGKLSPRLQTNLEAAAEVARQLRLRNLSGLILIDFLKSQSTTEKDQLMDTLYQALKLDNVKNACSALSQFGIVEITRQRVGASINEIMAMPCDKCHGVGFLLEN